jgi:predicted nucleic acid-binding protein
VALTFLLDTSVLKRIGQRRVVEPLAARGELARARICDLEVGYSARNAAEWDQLVVALDVFEPIATTATHVRRALHVQRLLAERSQRGGKIPDLLVAAAAGEIGIAVLHYDSDFDIISDVTGQRAQWVVPAGDAD